MAQTGYSPISLYYSSTASATPTNTNLVNGELALNITDGKLFYKDNAGTVQTLATKAATSGSFSTTTISTSETLSYGTANGVAYLNGSKVVTTGSALTFDGAGTFGVGASSSVDGLIRVWNSTNDRRMQVSNNGTISILNSTYGSAGESPLAFQISNAEQMRLTSTGLGIGTSSPAGPLDVKAANAGGGGGIRLTSTTGTNGVNVKLNNSAGNFYFGIDTSTGGTFGNSNAAVLWYDAAQSMVFATNNAKQMTLDSSGNLGLGVTPSAWGTFKALQIASGSLAAVGTQTQLIQNAYWDGTNWKYINSSGALRYGIDTFSNAHAWYNAASGTAGTNISFTQAMTLDASGNLLLGTTSAPNNWGAATPKMRVTDGGIQIGSYGLIAEDVFNTDSLCLVTDITENICFGQYTVSGSTYTERMRIDSSGNLIQSAPSTAPTLSTNGTMVFNLTSNTNLRVSVRGSDGVTRTANLTLA